MSSSKKEARQGKLIGGSVKGQPSPYSNQNGATQGDYKQENEVRGEYYLGSYLAIISSINENRFFFSFCFQ